MSNSEVNYPRKYSLFMAEDCWWEQRVLGPVIQSRLVPVTNPIRALVGVSFTAHFTGNIRPHWLSRHRGKEFDKKVDKSVPIDP